MVGRSNTTLALLAGHLPQILHTDASGKTFVVQNELTVIGIYI